ncbi:methyltransferase [Izhakiella australiensis]|uniref:Methyltransferase n=1 Tax=Izhakiella australiensis TaxID=1926881 RepID=A0A1S8YMH4_9GAMM|nr:MerR family transcriptional regulator [Izhakiella australiensis]OON40250.1 methyltransferase [Izhakiella australiensis]
MYRISEVAALVGLSRTTLLYYEKLGIVKGIRLPNGYRSYSEQDVRRLRLVTHLHVAGLTLRECMACIDQKNDKKLLTGRLQQLEKEIAIKLQAKKLLEAMLGVSESRTWHHSLEKASPDAHLHWIKTQGFNEKEAQRVRLLSKNMYEHDSYMADFNHVFSGLTRLGPGCASDTLRALNSLPDLPKKILEIGCGRGAATRLLAASTQAQIIALDNELSYLDALDDMSNRVVRCCASMSALPFVNGAFDLIWSEGSAYIMGFSNALQAWKKYLKPEGYLAVSEMVWLSKKPDKRAQAFWLKNYPAMMTVEQNKMLIKNSGYELLTSFEMSKEAWALYLTPLKERVAALQNQLSNKVAWQDLKNEIDIHESCPGEYGYQFFIMQKRH